jgi:hypothetical protein
MEEGDWWKPSVGNVLPVVTLLWPQAASEHATDRRLMGEGE